MFDSEIAETQGHLRGGGFVGATAIEDDFAIAGNHVDGFFEFGGVHVNGAGNGFRFGGKFEGMAKVNDDDVFAAFHALVKLVGSDASDAQAAQKAAALEVFPSDIKQHTSDHENKKAASEENELGGYAFDLTAENVADTDVDADPEQSSERVEEGEAGPRHASGAGERRGHGVESGNEFCEDESPGAAPFEMALRAADAGIGLEGDAAEEVQELHAAAAAEFVPEDVRNGGGNNG